MEDKNLRNPRDLRGGGAKKLLANSYLRLCVFTKNTKKSSLLLA